MGNSKIGFQFFADAGTLVNATGNYQQTDADDEDVL